MGMEFVPVGDTILVKVKKQGETKTASGLIMPAASNRNPTTGEIVAVGDTIEEGRFKAGEVLQWTENFGKEVKVLNEPYWLVPIEHVEGVFRKGN